MTYKGKIKDGVVVLEGGVKLPEGAAVDVNYHVQAGGAQPEVAVPTLYERLKPFIGSAQNLPPDAARNIDHYLYGLPKK